MFGLADSKLYQGTTLMEDTKCRFCCDTPNIQDTFTPMDFRNEANIPYWMTEDFLQDPREYDLPAMSAPTCSDEAICIPDDIVQRGRQMLRGKKPVGGKGSYFHHPIRKINKNKYLTPAAQASWHLLQAAL